MNTARQIILELQMPRDEKQVMLLLADIFDQDMPDTLYLNHYELAHGHPIDQQYEKTYYEGNPGTTPSQWEQFLDLPEIIRYSHSKRVKLMEMSANKAMRSLTNRDDVNALKTVLEQSKRLNGGQNREKFILTYVSPKERGDNHESHANS